MKNILLSIFFILFNLVSYAQELEVISFEIVPNDLTARTNSRVDGNGRKCALIKVYADDHIAAVRGAVIGDVSGAGMEKLVYMSHDAKAVELVFDHHLPLKIVFDDFGYPTITGQMTYVCKLKETTRQEQSESVVKISATMVLPVSERSTVSPRDLIKNKKKAESNSDESSTNNANGSSSLIASVLHNTEQAFRFGDIELLPFDGVIRDFSELIFIYPLLKYKVEKGNIWNLTEQHLDSIAPYLNCRYKYKDGSGYNLDSEINRREFLIKSANLHPIFKLSSVGLRNGAIISIHYALDFSYGDKRKIIVKEVQQSFDKFADSNGFKKVSSKTIYNLSRGCTEGARYYLNPQQRIYIQYDKDPFGITISRY